MLVSPCITVASNSVALEQIKNSFFTNQVLQERLLERRVFRMVGEVLQLPGIVAQLVELEFESLAVAVAVDEKL